MKLTGAKLATFLAHPDPAIRLVLLFGDDEGLVRERALGLVKHIADDASDPFRVVELDSSEVRSDPARLSDEAAAIAMTGGRRVVRVRNVTDGITKAVGAALEGGGDALMVLEAGGLSTRSSLRKLCEKAPAAVAVGCYTDSGQALEQVIRQTFATMEVEADRDCVSYLCDRLGSDRMVTRQEVEKLALYAGRGNKVTLRDAAACVGDSAGLSLDDALFAAGAGDGSGFERALDEAIAGGTAPVTILRAAMRHFQRLHLAGCHRACGASESEAIARLLPPVFFRVADRFRAELRRWPAARSAKALDLLVEAEEACKATGAPAMAICRDALLRLSRAASQMVSHRA